VQGGNGVSGLLYTPTLSASDPCVNASAPYIPANVTTQSTLPNTDYDLIAIAPWTSPSCVQSYFSSAREAPIQGFLFFLPHDNSTDMPPEANSNVWGLGDGGNWKRENDYPVYVLPGADAQTLLAASALYSKNMTDVPFGRQIAAHSNPQDYVRLFVEIDTSGGRSSLPSLWVFLLIVLGVLLTIIGFTSMMMHWLQSRRRRSLRRRVANGEVDLEALGIKRLTVPQAVLDEMPMYIYGTGAPVPAGASKETTAAKLETPESSRPSSPLPTTRPTPALIRSTSFHPSPLQQPTCAICLDDFVPASDGNEGTTVRELPCRHIFHPECVDTFLRDNSSLCPLCKKSVLPNGYCPRNVTNAMVRRERMVRRSRDRRDPEPETHQDEAGDSVSPLNSFGRRIRNFSGLSQSRPGRRISSAPTPSSQPMTEMATPTPALVRSNSATSRRDTQQRVQPPSNPSRREWARQRAVAMLGRRAPPDPDIEEQRTTPGWRKALRGVFPVSGR